MNRPWSVGDFRACTWVHHGDWIERAGDTDIMTAQMGSGDIAELVQQMEQSEDDPRRCYALVKQRISEYRQSGNAVPDDLARMERSLMVECMQASQGR